MKVLTPDDFAKFKKLLLVQKLSVNQIRDIFKIRRSRAYAIADQIISKSGAPARPKSNNTRKLYPEKVQLILSDRFIKKLQVSIISRNHKISEASISKILAGISWSDQLTIFKNEHPEIDFNRFRIVAPNVSKLNSSDVINIHRSYHAGLLSPQELMAKYNISKGYLSNIILGKRRVSEYNLFQKMISESDSFVSSPKSDPFKPVHDGSIINSSLISDKAQAIFKSRYLDKMAISEISKKYNVSQSNISNMLAGRIWNHDLEYFKAKHPDIECNRFRVNINREVKLTSNDVMDILSNYYNSELSQIQIRIKYNISQGYLCNILAGRVRRSEYNLFQSKMKMIK